MLEPCPRCKSRKVRRSASYFRHLWRTLWRNRRRYCVSCKEKWIEADFLSIEESTTPVPSTLVIGTALVVGFIAAYAGGLSFDPINWFKTLVKGHYDATYGKDSKTELWQNLGFIYGGKKDAKDDYYRH